jgi:hypothetical protein
MGYDRPTTHQVPSNKNLQRLIKVSYNKGVNPNAWQEEALINDTNPERSNLIGTKTDEMDRQQLSYRQPKFTEKVNNFIAATHTA